MKTFIKIIAVAIATSSLLACNNKSEERLDRLEKMVQKIETNTNINNPTFRLYPTTNLWNFLKLDTRNGKTSMVQYSVSDKSKRMEYPLSETPQCEGTTPGRFTLQPTENSYNFIMLDQLTGHTYQVQWSFDENNRFVIPIN